jgi:hypothetical protein
MRTPEVVLAAVAAIVLVCGCRKSAAPEASPSAAAEAAPDAPPAAPAAAPAPGAQGPAFSAPTPQAQSTMIIAVRFGPNPGEGGGDVAGGVFRPGQDVTASVDASALPPGAIVKVNWFDADGGGRGEEHKPVPAGAHWITFTAPGSSSWAEGTYRVEFLVSTGGFASEAFTIGQLTERPTEVPG